MIWICLLMPACFSVLIQYQRNGNKPLSGNVVVELCRWGAWVLTDNLLTIFTVLYLLGYGSLQTEVFESFSFAMKYAGISLVFACILPYILEIIRKFVSVTFTVNPVSQEEK